MKKHLSLIAALCALLTGCAKENPGPIDEPEANLITVTIGASVQENTKTAIGEKDGDRYPVLWTEGDRIAVNGVASEPARIENEGRNAFFEVTVPEADRYTLVYPYTEGNEAGEVTFAGLALPMWAETTDLEQDVEFKPLYSVLKLSVKGSAEITKLILTTQDGTAVSGRYTVGEGGTLTASSEAATSCEVEFGTPVQLSETAHDFYVPVPAADGYNIIDVQLFDNAGKSMTKKVDAGAKPLTAGKIREFPAFGYEANEHVFVIASTADMTRFAELVEAGSFAGTYEGVKVVKDIEAPADWTALDYSGAFDGCNKIISALKAPLFGTLNDAEVKNVVIAANMTNTSALNYGALAQETTGEITIDNCKVSGTVLLNLNGNTSTDKFNFAGLVGLAGGGSITNSQSTANVQLNHPGTGAKEIHIGGIAGEVAAGVTIDNCTINGELIKTNDSNGNNSVNIFIGGIAGLLNNGGTIQNCIIPKKTVNSGVSLSIRMNVNTYRAGGIVGQSLGMVQDCSNAQGISASKGSQQISYCYLGGIAGASNKNSVVKGCTNTGTIYCGNASGTTYAKTVQARIGGIAGTALDVTVDSCTNGGNIEYSGNASLATYFAVGGILGIYDAGSANGLTMKDWSNTGNITICPTVPTAKSGAYQVGVGGLLGVQLSRTITTTGTNSNSGKITVSKAFAPTNTGTANNYAYVGGCVGVFRGTAGQWNMTNDNGNITVGTYNTETKTYTADLNNVCVGGLFGHTSAGSTSHAKFYGCHVRCTLINNFNTGLICGWSGSNKEAKNCFFAGTVKETAITADNVNTSSVLFSDNTSAGVSGNVIWE